MGTVIAILFIVAVIIGCGFMLMNSPVQIKGYSSEYLERVLGRIKVGGETLTGRFVCTQDGYDHYVIMTRNDDLEPPYQAVRTVQCPDCQMIVLPLSGCHCNVTRDANDQWLKRVPVFIDTAPASFAHTYFAGYPEKA